MTDTYAHKLTSFLFDEEGNEETCECDACRFGRIQDEEDSKLDGTRCRDCGVFYYMAVPDYEKADKKLTCWICRNPLQ